MEKDLERKCREYVESRGGRLPKWVSPGNRGVQDRILLLPSYPVGFVEFKHGRGAVRPDQERWHAWMRDNGFRSYTVRDMEAFLAVIDDLKRRTPT